MNAQYLDNHLYILPILPYSSSLEVSGEEVFHVIPTEDIRLTRCRPVVQFTRLDRQLANTQHLLDRMKAELHTSLVTPVASPSESPAMSPINIQPVNDTNPLEPDFVSAPLVESACGSPCSTDGYESGARSPSGSSNGNLMGDSTSGPGPIPGSFTFADSMFKQIPEADNDYLPPPLPTVPTVPQLINTALFVKSFVCLQILTYNWRDLFSLGSLSMNSPTVEVVNNYFSKKSWIDLFNQYPILRMVFRCLYNLFPDLPYWRHKDITSGLFSEYKKIYCCPCKICPYCLASLTMNMPPYNMACPSHYVHSPMCRPCSMCQFYLYTFEGYRIWQFEICKYTVNMMSITAQVL